jgi:putative Mn2+ efflux pump MntP
VIGLMSGTMCILGLFLGRALADYLSSRAELLSGVLLLVLAVAIVVTS